jgi:hypothetical protein
VPPFFGVCALVGQARERAKMTASASRRIMAELLSQDAKRVHHSLATGPCQDD